MADKNISVSIGGVTAGQVMEAFGTIAEYFIEMKEQQDEIYRILGGMDRNMTMRWLITGMSPCPLSDTSAGIYCLALERSCQVPGVSHVPGESLWNMRIKEGSSSGMNTRRWDYQADALYSLLWLSERVLDSGWIKRNHV